jgi:dimeric dUTPase (all-alpha-NTP-PPase superfamily)
MISLLKDATSIERWYQKYLILGYHLGFSFNDIYEAYFKKNQINFKRQQENY